MTLYTALQVALAVCILLAAAGVAWLIVLRREERQSPPMSGPPAPVAFPKLVIPPRRHDRQRRLSWV